MADPTTPQAPMPQTGGSYVRLPDGTLQREEFTRPAAKDPAEAPAPGDDTNQ
jgi:hypothetical protein